VKPGAHEALLGIEIAYGCDADARSVESSRGRHELPAAANRTHSRRVGAAGGADDVELLRPITLHECRHAFASLTMSRSAL